MFMICTKIDFSTRQSTITGITFFPDEELFILALYFTLLQQPISIPTFSSPFLNHFFGLFSEVMFISSYRGERNALGRREKWPKNIGRREK